MPELFSLAADTDCTKPPQGWAKRHDQLRAEFVIAASGKAYLSKLTDEEWKHALMDMVIAIGRDNDYLSLDEFTLRKAKRDHGFFHEDFLVR